MCQCFCMFIRRCGTDYSSRELEVCGPIQILFNFDLYLETSERGRSRHASYVVLSIVIGTSHERSKQLDGNE